MRREKNQELINRIGKLVKAYETEPTGREVDGTVELLKDIAIYLTEEGSKLTVDTPISAEIIAEISSDPQYPGIYLYYKDKEEKDCDRDTALLEWDDTNKHLPKRVVKDFLIKFTKKPQKKCQEALSCS